jgi:hypothetical protein
MGYANTIMGGSSSSKPFMETRMEKPYYRRTSTRYYKITHTTSPSSLDVGIHPSSTTTTYTTHP